VPAPDHDYAVLEEAIDSQTTLLHETGDVNELEHESVRRAVSDHTTPLEAAAAAAGGSVAGVVWAINGVPSHADRYVNPRLFAKVWRKLLRAAGSRDDRASHATLRPASRSQRECPHGASTPVASGGASLRGGPPASPPLRRSPSERHG